MIERNPYSVSTNLPLTVTIYDRLLASGSERFMDHSFSFLYLRDQQPVIAGARYQYFVVRFNSKHEPQETIPAGMVEIPSN